MVNEISEASLNIVDDVDMSPVEEGFLDRISKRKEEESPFEIEIENEAASLSHIQHLLSTPYVYGGGVTSTEKERNKISGSEKSQQSNDLHQLLFNDQWRRKSILAPASTSVSPVRELQQATPAEMKKIGQQVGINELKLTGINKVAPQKQISELDINVTSLAVKEKAFLSNPELVMANNLPLESQFEKDLTKSTKTAEMIPVDVATPQRSETSTRREKVHFPSEALQKQMTGRTSASKTDAVSQSMDLKYQFQSWSGDHSVKVSVSPETRSAGNIILHPSDPRAADALTKQVGNLVGYTPDIVQPRQGREEREQQNRDRETQDDEQE